MRIEIADPRHDTFRSGRTAGRCATANLKKILEFSIAVAFEIETTDLRKRTRGRADTAFARQVAMYLAHVAYGLTLSDVGRVFERDRTTVAYACGVVEDRRDDATIDRTLDLLETVVARLAHITQCGSCPSGCCLPERVGG
jgi:chromosomal replication initiation ATPase DnaA